MFQIGIARSHSQIYVCLIKDSLGLGNVNMSYLNFIDSLDRV